MGTIGFFLPNSCVQDVDFIQRRTYEQYRLILLNAINKYSTLNIRSIDNIPELFETRIGIHRVVTEAPRLDEYYLPTGSSPCGYAFSMRYGEVAQAKILHGWYISQPVYVFVR